MKYLKTYEDKNLKYGIIYNLDKTYLPIKSEVVWQLEESGFRPATDQTISKDFNYIIINFQNKAYGCGELGEGGIAGITYAD